MSTKIKHNDWIIGCDPYKKIKWYHRVMKFFGRKIKTGSIVIFKWTDETKTTVKVVKQSDTFL